MASEEVDDIPAWAQLNQNVDAANDNTIDSEEMENMKRYCAMEIEIRNINEEFASQLTMLRAKQKRLKEELLALIMASKTAEQDLSDVSYSVGVDPDTDKTLYLRLKISSNQRCVKPNHIEEVVSLFNNTDAVYSYASNYAQRQAIVSARKRKRTQNAEDRPTLPEEYSLQEIAWETFRGKLLDLTLAQTFAPMLTTTKPRNSMNILPLPEEWRTKVYNFRDCKEQVSALNKKKNERQAPLKKQLKEQEAALLPIFEEQAEDKQAQLILVDTGSNLGSQSEDFGKEAKVTFDEPGTETSKDVTPLPGQQPYYLKSKISVRNKTPTVNVISPMVRPLFESTFPGDERFSTKRWNDYWCERNDEYKIEFAESLIDTINNFRLNNVSTTKYLNLERTAK